VTTDMLSRPQPRRRQSTIKRRSASFHLSAASLAAVERLVELEVYPNKSIVVDTALKHLIAYHADELRDVPAAVEVAA
jgi:Arc/MetJ-type ribon-helix-helix transcriptional regulator